jgi:SAM-dependent methyltransferase
MHVHSPELAQALPALLPAGLAVVDLGCGVGYYLSELAKNGYMAYGVEGTPDIQGIALHTPIYQADLSEPLSVPLPGTYSQKCSTAPWCF